MIYLETQFRNKIQVVHLVTNLQSHGAERIMAKIVTESDPAKFHHHVVSMGSIGPIGEYLRAEGITVEALAMSAKLSLAIAPFRFAAILRRFNPDVLHCWMYHANLFGALIAKIASVPHIVWSIRASNTNLAYYSLLTR